MNEPPLNPYAVALPVDQPSEVVHFGGKLTRDDLMMSLHDSPPKKGMPHYRYLVLIALAVGVLVASEFVFVVPGEPPAGFVWIVIGFLLLFPWIELVNRMTPGRRRRVRRINAVAAAGKSTAGWLDDQHLVLCNDETMLRAKWGFFGPALLFPTHVLLPLSADSNHRVVFPWRFFGSVEDAKQVCHSLRVKTGLMVDQVDEKVLAASIGRKDAIPRIDVGLTRSFDALHWPFQSDSEGQSDWTLDLTAKQTSQWFALKSMLAILLFMLLYFLPIWGVVVGWLIHDYLFFGNWGFLRERVFSSVIVLGPAALLLGFFIYSAVRAASQLRSVQSKPLQIRLRAAGAHLSHATFDSWFAWSACKELILDEKSVGWIDRQSLDEVRFPVECFEDRAGFDRFRETLSKIGPARAPSTDGASG